MSPRYSNFKLLRQVFLLLLILSLGALPLLSNGYPDTPGNPKLGRDLFVKKGCIRCHSVWNSGGKKGPNLASVGMGRNLYELCASVWSHWSRMNAVLERANEMRASLSATEFKDIIAYLYYLNYNSEPADSESGARIFNSKGCDHCHALYPLQARDKPGRAVYEMQRFQSAVTLAVAVWNHGTDMRRQMSERRMQWPEFKGKEVADLVEFVRSRNGSTDDTEMTVPGDPLKGQSLFVSKACAGCHRQEGGHRLAPNLASSGAATSLSSLVATLWNHYPRMSQTISTSGIAYPKISREEMQDLVAYVYWVRAYGLAGNPAAGRTLYQSKQCAVCHTGAQSRPAVAPALERSEATLSAYGLLSAIWNHGYRMESILREKKIAWPALSGDEMRDLVAFFRSMPKF